MIQLTPEQRQALSDATSEAVRAVDPATHAQYVLIRAELYERLRSLDSEGWGSAAATAAIEVFARDGWDDPRMDVYDSLAARAEESVTFPTPSCRK